jgi:hypothetical protein
VRTFNELGTNKNLITAADYIIRDSRFEIHSGLIREAIFAIRVRGTWCGCVVGLVSSSWSK